MKLVLATRNQGKVRELAEMLCNSRTANRESRTANNRSIEVISLKSYSDAPEVVEDGITYAENAIKKASVIAQYTGQLTLADDAGLEVNALNGAPGVNSKRWVGEDATDTNGLQASLKPWKVLQIGGHVLSLQSQSSAQILILKSLSVFATDELPIPLLARVGSDMIRYLYRMATNKPSQNWEKT